MTDIVASIIVWLRTQLDPPKRVGAKVPDDVPRGQFVLVRRLGGNWERPVVDAATIGIEAWGATQAQAHDLCQEARALVHSLQGTVLAGVAVYRVEEFAGPAWLPDPESAEPRFTVTLNVSHREHLEVPA
jgi:hypothetical protein